MDTDTQIIPGNIPTILQHLFTNYGYVDSDTISDKENEVESMEFSVAKPLTCLYKEIKNLQQLATAGGELKREETANFYCIKSNKKY